MTWHAGPGHFELDEEYKPATNSWIALELRHHLTTPEGSVGIIVHRISPQGGATAIVDRYFLKDHLGSNAGSYVASAIDSRSSFDVWG
jgi:hypothetical protein